MGVIYRVCCERCGTAFEHQTGIGFVCSCVDCGERIDDDAPFFCPVCSRRFVPTSAGFADSLLEVIHEVG